MTVMLFAPTETVVAIGTEFSAIVNVDDVAALFSITILLITVVVADGTVYRVVPVLVVAAPLKRTLVVVAISYYPFA
jgi:hypothetical protein